MLFVVIFINIPVLSILAVIGIIGNVIRLLFQTKNRQKQVLTWINSVIMPFFRDRMIYHWYKRYPNLVFNLIGPIVILRGQHQHPSAWVIVRITTGLCQLAQDEKLFYSSLNFQRQYKQTSRSRSRHNLHLHHNKSKRYRRSQRSKSTPQALDKHVKVPPPPTIIEESATAEFILA